MNLRTFQLGWASTIVFSIAGCLLLANNGWALVTFNVNSIDDGVDYSPGDGNCSTNASPTGPCTLRAAVMEANRAPNLGAIINLPAGTYTLKIFPDAADGEGKGDLNLLVPPGYSPGPTTIIGAGAATTIIDANGIDRVLSVDRSAAITGISFINGLITSYGGQGGGIRNTGTLTLADCVIKHNTVSYGSGGGIYTDGFLGATRITLDDNTASAQGGGICNADHLDLSQSILSANKALDGAGIFSSGSLPPYPKIDSTKITGNTARGSGGGLGNNAWLTLTRTTVSGNTAEINGGGVLNTSALYASNSTISVNSARQDGGGVYNDFNGISNIYNSTIAYNEADADFDSVGSGAGIYNNGATVNLRNSVVAENYVPGVQSYDDCSGAIGMYGNNKFSPTVDCTVAAGSTGTATQLVSLYELGPLQDNGGPTPTIALVPPSSMIDGADAIFGCVDQNSVTLTTDQRGRPRSVGTSCDIGAFEYDDDIFKNAFEAP